MSGKRVLIVDDDPALLEALPETLQLRMPGLDVDTSDSAPAALQRIAATDYDVIVTDIKMPGVDGLALLAEIRRRRPGTPTLLITGHGEHDLAVQALRGGAYDYIPKPIDREYFVMALGRALHVRDLGRQVEAQRSALERHARELEDLVDERTRELSTQLADMRRLHDLSVRLGRTLELGPVMTETLAAVTTLLNTEAGVLMLCDRGRRDASVVASAGLDDQDLDVLRQLLSTAGPGQGRSIMWTVGEVPESAWAKEALEVARRARYAGLHATPVVSRTGELIGTILVFVREARPPSDRQVRLVELYARHAGDLLEHAQLYREAQEANRAKDDFLATLSHELRTPLTAILGWARLLRTGRLEDRTRLEALAAIERNAVAQAKLVDDLLDVSRIIAGKFRLDLMPVALQTVVDAACAAIRPGTQAKGITLTCESSPEELTVRGDAERLQQVVWNLLSNAVKFTEAGGRVDVRLLRELDHAVLTVTDTGKGIAADFLPRVFDRFRQADSSITRSSGGLGLGLAIAHHLVELHQGTIWVKSAGPGLGSTFGVTLPLIDPAAADAVDAGALATTEPDGRRRPDLRGVRVLTVDDDNDALTLIGVALSQAGADVQTARSVSTAVTVFRMWRPDVVISDLGMPGEDGYTLIRQIRAFEADGGARVPALALTAWARPEDRSRTTAAGYDGHLPKPVDPQMLARAVEALARSAPDRTPPGVPCAEALQHSTPPPA